MQRIQNGSTIEYADSFGAGMTRRAKVTRIELVESGEKYGSQVISADLNEVKHSENYVLTLDNGKWAYGHQVKELIDGKS